MCTNASRSGFPNRAIDRTDPAWRSSRAVSLSSQQRSPSTWTPGPARTASAELCPGTASENEIDGPSTARPVPPVRASPTLTPSIAGHTMRPAVSAAAVGSEPLNVSEPVFDTIEKGEKDDCETVSRSRRRKRRTRSPTSNHPYRARSPTGVLARDFGSARPACLPVLSWTPRIRLRWLAPLNSRPGSCGMRTSCGVYQGMRSTGTAPNSATSTNAPRDWPRGWLHDGLGAARRHGPVPRGC